MSEQDKPAEIQASGTVLSRFDFEVWDRHLACKEDNLRAAKLDTISGASILDFGCGPGTYGILLGKRNYVVGVDIAKQAVEQARNRAKLFHSNFDAILADGERLGFRIDSMDVCFSGWAIHHLPNVEYIIKQFHEYLKPNGLAVIVEPNEDSLGLRIARFFEDRLNGLILKYELDTPNRTTHKKLEYLDALGASGFEIVTVFTHYNGDKSEVPNDVHGISAIALRLVIEIRHMILLFSTHVLRDGAEVFIIARKLDSDARAP